MSRSVYILAPVLVLSLSLPLAALAVITTSLAFTTLFVRLLYVYFELGMALVHSWLFSHDPIKSPRISQPRFIHPVHDSLSQRPSKYRRRSGTPIPQDIHPGQDHPRKSESSASLPFSVSGPDRDFEGVGGWSLAREGEDNTNWTGLNPRLQLPASGGEQRRRHHQRSLTSASQRFARSPDSGRWSPIELRIKTSGAPEGRVSPEEYFSVIPDGAMIMSPEEMTARIRMGERQKSLTSSGTSSPVNNRKGIYHKESQIVD